MHSLGLRAAATRLFRAQAKGRKKESLQMINQITLVGFLGARRSKESSPERHARAQLQPSDQEGLEGQQQRMASTDAMAPSRLLW